MLLGQGIRYLDGGVKTTLRLVEPEAVRQWRHAPSLRQGIKEPFMTTRNVVHASFTITRNWPHPPAKVFHAFADEQAKAKWFGGPPGWEQHKKSFDFREGGMEHLSGRHANGMVSAFDCTYHDIVAQ